MLSDRLHGACSPRPALRQTDLEGVVRLVEAAESALLLLLLLSCLGRLEAEVVLLAGRLLIRRRLCAVVGDGTRTVVIGTKLLIHQDLVRLGQLLELLRGRRLDRLVAVHLVRVRVPRLRVVGAPDLGRSRRLLEAEPVVQLGCAAREGE